jgi:hypothetical protein
MLRLSLIQVVGLPSACQEARGDRPLYEGSRSVAEKLRHSESIPYFLICLGKIPGCAMHPCCGRLASHTRRRSVLHWESSRYRASHSFRGRRMVKCKTNSIRVAPSLASPATSDGGHCRQGTAGYMILLSLATAAKAGRAMELSSPVASLVPGLVDNAVVTCGDSCMVRGDPV